jgi:hypothetical protein
MRRRSRRRKRRSKCRYVDEGKLRNHTFEWEDQTHLNVHFMKCGNGFTYNM